MKRLITQYVTIATFYKPGENEQKVSFGIFQVHLTIIWAAREKKFIFMIVDKSRLH